MQVGTILVGMVNNAKFKVVEVKKDNMSNYTYITLKDLKTGNLYVHSMDMLNHCYFRKEKTNEVKTN